MEREVQPHDASSDLDRSTKYQGRAPQQQLAGGPTGLLGEQQHRQAFQRDPRAVEERPGQPVHVLEAGRLQEPPSHHGEELQHVWTHLQVRRGKQMA